MTYGRSALRTSPFILRIVAIVCTTALCSISVPVPASAAVSSWHKGASFIPFSSTEFAGGNFQQSVRNFKAAGGNYVNFIIPYYQSNTGSTDINPGYNTPTDASLISGIQFVHSLGMKAQVGIYLETYDGTWRALINPGNRADWFAKYQAILVKYGQIGQQQGVEQMVLGAELVNMASAAANPDNTTRWNQMIAAVRGVYSGKLTYSANRGGQGAYSELPNIQFWNNLDYIGVSGYYELSTDGSVSSLKNAWANIQSWDIGPAAQKWNKPVLFTEIGYRSLSGAHYQPWNSSMGGSYDPQEQVNDYTALFDFWNNYSYLQGVDLWWWSPDPNYGGSGNTDYTPQGKPAEQTLKQWWGTTISPPPPPPPSGTPAFQTTSTISPSQPATGQSTTLTANVKNTGTGPLQNGIVDLEIYDQSNNRVLQKFFETQNITQGSTQPYSLPWTPQANGTYRLAVGIFSSGWAQTLDWNNSTISFSVGTGQNQPPPPPPPTSPAITNIWWPTDGSHINGLQPFKAMLEGVDVSQYSMYWQVDGGPLVQMNTNTTDYPHKEALVDLSGWNWQGGNAYTITFASKKTDSTTAIAQKSIKIFTP
ncbi:MAG: hypothetical protein JWN18_446 [Parcubacteria group bacterium]|nr:hypothetical protein [Parcubacteria group bacterium]